MLKCELFYYSVICIVNYSNVIIFRLGKMVLEIVCDFCFAYFILF